MPKAGTATATGSTMTAGSKPLESIAEIEVSDGRDLLRADNAERESEYEVERDEGF